MYFFSQLLDSQLFSILFFSISNNLWVFFSSPIRRKFNAIYLFGFRSVPTAVTTPSYQWPSSPILPPISSRTPHLVPETYVPTSSSNSTTTSAPTTNTLINNNNSSSSNTNNNNNLNSNHSSSIGAGPSGSGNSAATAINHANATNINNSSNANISTSSNATNSNSIPNRSSS